MNNTIRRLLPVAAVFAASPAFACGGGPEFTQTQMSVLVASMISAPLLAALLVDRGAFALAAFATGMKRRHRPTFVGPMVALTALFVTMASVSLRDVNLAVVGFALIPVAAGVCGLSFVRSVIIEQRGNRRAQLLRVAAVGLFGALAWLPFAT